MANRVHGLPLPRSSQAAAAFTRYAASRRAAGDGERRGGPTVTADLAPPFPAAPRSIPTTA
ncbi:hypothetical protein GCM10010254_33540 [Streptomyces chromofuscus]|nr:hypothetical protein GCM10010254_33540 [Streptomyces chromofuscus]